jgi:hypothetical protein
MLAGSHIIFANSLFSNFTEYKISAFILGIISHHLADKLPHIDLNILKTSLYRDYTFQQFPFRVKLVVFVELMLGFLFSFYYFVGMNKIPFDIFIFLSLGSLFPDLITIFLKNKLSRIFIFNLYFNFHKNFHFKLRKNNLLYVLSILSLQILILIFSLIFFKFSLSLK